jgi:hypothetical protein
MPRDDQNTPEETVERRVALRRGAAVLAGVAGLSAAGAAAASSASAAPGDPLVLGQGNDSGATATTVTSASSSTTLQVANTGTGAPLRVAVLPGAAGFPSTTSVAGEHHSTDFNADGFAFPVFTHVSGTGDTDPPVVGFVYTDEWASQPIAVVPQRALDTRTAAGRVRVNNPAGNFDATGRLIGGHTITLSLADFAIGFGAVLGNITVTGTAGAGFVSVYPADPRPTPSSINFVAGQTLSNFSFTGWSFDGSDLTVRIFALVTTHVIFDITGLAVGSTAFINPEILPAAATSAASRRIDLAKAPEWFRKQHAQRNR